jgi:lysine-arginine-ornithine-binding protein
MKKIVLSAIAAIMVLGAGSAMAGKMKVRMGTEGAYPPFNFIDKSGKLQGFDIDIGNAICKAANFECSWVTQDWDGIIPGLIAEKYDTIIASMSITDERKKKVDFSNKYYTTPARFVTSEKNAKMKFSKDILKGKTIGVQSSTIHENFVRDNFGDIAKIKSYDKQEQANLDLKAGRVDYVLADAVALDDGFLKTPAGKGFVFTGPNYTDKKWFGDGAGIAIRKGEDKLRKALNAAIDKIRADGTYAKINAKYFDFDVYGD